MTRFGIIEEIDAEKGRARVNFREDGVISGWLPVSVQRAKEDKFGAMPTKGEHVWCIMEPDMSNGVVGGAIYDDANTPPEAKTDTFTGVTYRDGTKVGYDSDAHEMTVENTGSLTINVTAGTKVTLKSDGSEVTIEPDGITVKRGGESLKSILSDLLTQLAAETHPTPVGPTGPPLNAPAYNGIKTRVSNLLK